jgi:ATP synthase protein I
MLASYATVVRRAVAMTAVVAVIAVALSAGLVGMKGLIGALAGVALIVVFFGISIVVVGRAAKVSPAAMMIAALSSYVIKIIVLAFVVHSLDGTTAFSTKSLGFTAVACILAWSVAQVIAAIKVKMLYVEPSGNH